MHTLEEPRLLARAREGESAAFAELYRRHAGSLAAYAIDLAGPSDADDLVAEALARTWVLLAGGAGPARGFSAYLRRAVRNQYLNHLRSHARIDRVPDPEAALLALGRADLPVHASAEARALAAAERARVRAAVASLPERWRTVLVRLYFEDAPLARVADDLGLRPGAAAQLALRARRGLFAALAGDAADLELSA